MDSEALGEEAIEKHYAIDPKIRKWVRMGPGSYHGNGFDILYEKDGGNVSIGRFTSIGQNVKIFCGGYHHTDWVTTSPLREDRKSTYSKGETFVGSDCWIGDGAVLMSGVTVNHGAVVAAYSVVTKDVEPFAIVGGNPAKHIRFRFTPEQMLALCRIAWWDWPEEVVRERQLELCCPDIDAFIDKYRVPA